MSKNILLFPCSFIYLLLLGLFLSSTVGTAQTTRTSTRVGDWTNTTTWRSGTIPTRQENATIVNDSVIIPTEETVEINTLEIGGGGKLVVNGTLIIHQSASMSNNSLGFTMGPSAAVIVYGNFEIKNQVRLSLSSLLVIHGNFDKSGSGNQGDVTIEDGSIYVFGDVTGNGWPSDFACNQPEYSGNTPTEAVDCDYGNINDFEDNQDSIPDEFQGLINCYDLSSVKNISSCIGGTATFKVSNPNLTGGVSFQWQIKNTTWENVGTGSSLSVSPTSAADFEKLYRVVVKPTGTASCKISISENVRITPIESLTWNGTLNSDWNNTANWSCNGLPTLKTDVLIPAGLPNYPKINSGATAMAKDIIIQKGATLSVDNFELQIAGGIFNSGVFNAAKGSISLVGNSAQIIPVESFVDNSLKNLTIKNPSGVTSEGVLEITGILKAQSGNLNTGNNLTLISDENQTALIAGSGNGQVTGTVKMQRYLDNSFGYKYFSTPFQNSIVGDLAANFELTNSETGFPHLYEYFENRKDGAENDLTGWQKYINTASSLKPGSGYAINPSGEPDILTLELSGVVNNGPINVSLENNNGTYTNGFNLVGNPYPSPINWELMVPTLEGIDNAIHFFTASEDNRYAGTYTSYVDGVSTDGRSSSIIPSMQGFFVRVSDPETEIYPATANLQFTNSVRVGNETEQNYYKTKNKPEIPQIKLTAAFKGEGVVDATVIYFRNGGTPEFEKEIDAQKILNTAINVPSFYSLSTKKTKMAINAVSGFSVETMEIPLGISSERSGEIILALSETVNIFPSYYIYLKDNKKKVLKDLNDNPVYSFTTQKGENNDRFILFLSSKKLSTAEIVLATEDFIIYTEDDEIIVKLNLPNNDSKGKVILSNMSGQVLQSKMGYGKEEVRFYGIQSAGIYMVTLETATESLTKKVIFRD